MQSFTAPAKINLFLHVTGRRADGYHQLQTAFQFVDLADTIHIDVTDDVEISRTGGPVDVAPEDDLAVRAARALQEYAGVNKGAALHVEKRIPAGAGLGGGSSDAATTLVALNSLWGTGFGRDELADIGLSLGADVPVFIHGRSAWAEGVGERLTPLDYPERSGVLIVPAAHVPTPEVFADPALKRDTVRVDREALHADQVVNDLEPVAERLYPDVAAARDTLQGLLERTGSGERATPVRMSGSGSAVFALINEESVGDGAGLYTAALVRDFKATPVGRESRLVMPIRTRNRHPLLSSPGLMQPVPLIQSDAA